jgi:hypothetical protein
MKVSLYGTDYNPPELIAAVRRGFESAGIEAEVATDRPMPEMKGPATNGGPHLVELLFGDPLRTFMTTFFGAAGAAAGQDAWKGFKRFLTVIFDQIEELWPNPPGIPRGPGDGAVILEDEEGLSVVLGPDLPDEALQALSGVDWDAVEKGSLDWDQERQEWRFHGAPGPLKTLFYRFRFWRFWRRYR